MKKNGGKPMREDYVVPKDCGDGRTGNERKAQFSTLRERRCRSKLWEKDAMKDKLMEGIFEQVVRKRSNRVEGEGGSAGASGGRKM